MAVTRAKRQLFLTPTLAYELRSFGLWDSLALQGTNSDQSLHQSLPVPCHGHGCDCTDARGVDTEAAPAASGNGEGASQAERFLFTGSGSIEPLCRFCVEGTAGELGDKGMFPYALKLSASRRTT